jgi:5-methylcytosine-specific restriction protein A
MSKLAEIAPTHRQRLIDLVKAAGIDISDWKNFKGGKKKEASNPKYCYEWSFVEPNRVVVLNLWHSAMEEEKDGGVVIRNVIRNMNMRQFASAVRGLEKTRALKFDSAIRTAIKDKLPIRVIVCDGKRRSLNQTGGKASHVSKRLLDPVSWSVTKYNCKTGECTLTRGSHRFVDQFSVQQEETRKPEKRDVCSQAYIRSPMVRSDVLVRADGKCEWCGQSGFVMADGKIYLETHHVVPLSEDGRDTEKNVAALCPNHHREAHHGAKKAEMRKELLSRLAG